MNANDNQLSDPILSIWDFESFCRDVLVSHPKASCLVVQMLIECSMQGQRWAKLKDVYAVVRGLTDHGPMSTIQKGIDAGLIEYKKELDGQLTSFLRPSRAMRLVAQSSVDGQAMLRIRAALADACKVHRKMTPYAALMLSAIYVRRMQRVSDIARFLRDGMSTSRHALGEVVFSNSSTTRVLAGFVELGLLRTVGVLGERGRPLLAFEVNP